MTPRTVCLVTSGHLTSCPRMLKAADAVADGGWRAHVVAASSLSSQRETDALLMHTRSWPLTSIEWGRDCRPAAWWWTRARQGASRTLCGWLGAGSPTAILGRAASRPYVELVAAASSIKADLYYGGGGGGTIAAAAAAFETGVPYAVDFEDLHSGEFPPGSREERMWKAIEARLVGGAAFVTAGSGAIASAYARQHACEVVPIHNTFPLPDAPPTIEVDSERVRFYWVGQTVGPGRGIEQCVQALSASGLSARVSLRGYANHEFVAHLQEQAAQAGNGVSIECLPFAPPTQIVAGGAGQDVGLALEPGDTENSRCLLSNKALTYLLAGLAPLLSETPGHAPLLSDLGSDALSARPSDTAGLACVLATLADRSRLTCLRRAAWDAAVRRWHWEHPDDRGRLLELIGRALG